MISAGLVFGGLGRPQRRVGEERAAPDVPDHHPVPFEDVQRATDRATGRRQPLDEVTLRGQLGTRPERPVLGSLHEQRTQGLLDGHHAHSVTPPAEPIETNTPPIALLDTRGSAAYGRIHPGW
jgi:hypothetical protein